MDNTSTKTGQLVWFDLTVPNADHIAQFYEQVVGWKTIAIENEGGDYGVYREDSPDMLSGICWARGSNANIPPQWLMYISIADVAAAAARCTELGGSILDGPRQMGGKLFCVLRDPAGAVMALIEG